MHRRIYHLRVRPSKNLQVLSATRKVAENAVAHFHLALVRVVHRRDRAWHWCRRQIITNDKTSKKSTLMKVQSNIVLSGATLMNRRQAASFLITARVVRGSA